MEVVWSLPDYFVQDPSGSLSELVLTDGKSNLTISLLPGQ